MQKPIKYIIRNIIRSLGFDIIRYQKDSNIHKSIRTNKLSFYETQTGNYYLPTDAHSDSIVYAIKNNLIFDKEVYEVAKKYVRLGTSVLDIGSNFGQMTVLMSKLVGDKGIVHSFDADDFVFEVLEKNIKENIGY